jgi:hypothetical protein
MAGTANGARVRRWFQDKKAGWYAVLADPRMPVTSTGIVNLLRLIPSSGTRICYPGSPSRLGGPLRACDLGPTLESMAHFLTVRRR